MLVYGDQARLDNPRSKLDAIAARLRDLPSMAPTIVRHGALVSVFIDAGELTQGLADAAFTARGHDARGAADQAAMALLLALARAVQGSWRTGFAASPPLPEAAIDGLARLPLPDAIEVKRPEGYAFYALYPEAYGEAAAALGPRRGMRVIGIRSIGTGLAAMVASAIGAPPPVTLRPVGHPFRRSLALAPAFAAELAGDPRARFAVADEGPGLSGSSFGAVADHLEAQGVAPERIHFFPGHAGDLGPEASPRHRARWNSARRHVVDFDALVLRAADPRHRLENWVGDLVGAPEAPLVDISGGAWRRHRFASEDNWPPANAQQERRKLLLHTATGTWLLKFAGLGREGERTSERARVLAAAGFTPEVAGFRHGFLVQRWIGEARPLYVAAASCGPGASIADRAGDRTGVLAHLGRYLGFRARRFPTDASRGASLSALLRMAEHNTSQALGEGAARSLAVWRSALPRLARHARAIETDNRLHRWEWLRRPDGRLLKSDAVDHHVGHDLIGCQDVAWDIAGAAVEWALSPEERDRLCGTIERESGRPVSPELLAFLTPCYLAFQLGAYAMAAASLPAWPEEASRLRAAAERYAGLLGRALGEASGLAS